MQTVERKIRSKRAVVGVVGQGYVGFPLAQRSAESGYRTYGFDISVDTVARCEKANRFHNYKAVLTPSALRACDVLIVAVPTPTKSEGGRHEPDLALVINAVRTLSSCVINDNQPRLLVLESTYAPGTTRTVVAPMLAEAIEAGRLALGYSPERIDPGNPRFNLVNTPKVTSGIDAAAAWLVNRFYSQIVDRVVPATNLEAAEATKILENTFRFISITFAQEFDSYCDRAGIDAREITNLASSKPFGFMPFYAGAGIGGHCIAEDPYYLYQSMLDLGMAPHILESAIENHEARAGVIVDRIADQLGGRPIAGARILLLGVSYKPNVGDPRRSPAQPILERLEAEGARVDYHDALVPRFGGHNSLELKTARPQDYDLAVLITAHQHLDYDALAGAGWRIYDTRGLIKRTPAGAALSEEGPFVLSQGQTLVEAGS